MTDFIRVLAMNDDNHSTHFVTEDGEDFSLHKFITKMAQPHEERYSVRMIFICDLPEEDKYVDAFDFVESGPYNDIWVESFDLLWRMSSERIFS